MSNYSDYSSSPAYLVRSWLSNEFLNSGIIDQIEYNGIDPIVPVQDIDKTSKSLGKLPYFVYSIVPIAIFEPEVFYIKEELIRISTLSNNIAQLMAINSFLIDSLDRRDITAREVNEFSASSVINFKTFTMIKSSEVEPIDQPAGRFVQTITFKYSYVRTLNSSGRFAF